MDDFLDLDDEDGSCPRCKRFDGELIYVSFSSKPVSCKECNKKMESEDEGFSETV